MFLTWRIIRVKMNNEGGNLSMWYAVLDHDVPVVVCMYPWQRDLCYKALVQCAPHGLYTKSEVQEGDL